MKEINIAQTIINKRREKGITQDDLAMYIGVSKASVSKWETGQSYPDITFLPQLAAYFNISIDELMSYSPQMTSEDIKRLYFKLASNFSKQPFDEAYEECKTVIKKYYSCFPLLMQMTVLLINHHMLAPEKKTQEEIIAEIIDLCLRVINESGDARLSKQANDIHAICLLIQNKPSEVVNLLDDTDYPSFASDGSILANAYTLLGNIGRAKEVLQTGMYEKLLSILNTAPMLISINADKPEKVDEIIKRMFAMADIFQIEKLHFNTMLLLCLSAGQSCAMRGETDRALEYLNRYADICCSVTYPIKLHGDAFFDNIDGWFEKFDLGPLAPREEKVIKESMLQGLTGNPMFAALKETPKYKRIEEKLIQNAGGNNNE